MGAASSRSLLRRRKVELLQAQGRGARALRRRRRPGDAVGGAARGCCSARALPGPGARRRAIAPDARRADEVGELSAEILAHALAENGRRGRRRRAATALWCTRRTRTRVFEGKGAKATHAAKAALAAAAAGWSARCRRPSCSPQLGRAAKHAPRGRPRPRRPAAPGRAPRFPSAAAADGAKRSAAFRSLSSRVRRHARRSRNRAPPLCRRRSRRRSLYEYIFPSILTCGVYFRLVDVRRGPTAHVVDFAHGEALPCTFQGAPSSTGRHWHGGLHFVCLDQAPLHCSSASPLVSPLCARPPARPPERRPRDRRGTVALRTPSVFDALALGETKLGLFRQTTHARPPSPARTISAHELCRRASSVGADALVLLGDFGPAIRYAELEHHEHDAGRAWSPTGSRSRRRRSARRAACRCRREGTPGSRRR